MNNQLLFLHKMLLNKFSQLLYIIFCGIAYAIDVPLKGVLLKKIFSILQIKSDNLYSDVLPYLILYLGTFLIIFTLFRIYDYFIGMKFFAYLRKSVDQYIFKYVLDNEIGYFYNNEVGKIGNKIYDLVLVLPESLELFFFHIIFYVFTIIISAYIFFSIHIFFTISLLIWFILACLVAVYYGKQINTIDTEANYWGGKINGHVVDSLSNILFVNVFSGKNKEMNIFNHYLTKCNDLEKKSTLVNLKLYSIQLYSFFILFVFSAFFLIVLYKNNKIDLGDFILVINTLFSLLVRLRDLGLNIIKLLKNYSRFTDAYDFLLTQEHRTKHDEILNIKSSDSVSIEFKEVSFSYKKNDIYALNNISILIEPGKKIGLVGFSGGGKTTFINLIMGLYQTRKGSILINGQDIDQVSLESLRDSISIVPQDPTLFNRSIKDNILYGCKDINITDQEIKEICKKAHCHDFIMQMDQGYDTLVGEKGSLLSGGQRQRICIARAFLRDAPIIILDEATSALDSITEEGIKKSIDELIKNKTAIIIAHKLSTLKTVDEIFVFEKANIIEKGSHSELIAKDNIYKKIYDKQLFVQN